MMLGIQDVILFIIIIMLAVIVYFLRVLSPINMKIIKIEEHIEKILKRVMKEEIKIEKRI